MPKITITNDIKTGQKKYILILPKEVMDEFAADKGDSLNFKSVVGNEITFKFKRKQ